MNPKLGPNTDGRFSGTILRRIDDDPMTGLKAGDVVFAMRGTEPGYNDLYPTDFNEIVKNGLAFRQIIDVYNYWQRLITPEGELARQATLVPANPPGKDFVLAKSPVIPKHRKTHRIEPLRTS